MNVKFYPASRGIALSVCISVNGKYEYISLGENVFPNEIDRKNQCISTKCKRKEELRSLIDPVIDILESIRDYWEKNNIEFGAKDLKVEYNKRTKGTHGIDQSTLVKSAFEEKIQLLLNNKRVNGSSVRTSKNTASAYNTCMVRLMEFCKSRNVNWETLSFSDLTVLFLSDFMDYNNSYDKSKGNKGTITTNMKNLKALCNAADMKDVFGVNMKAWKKLPKIAKDEEYSHIILTYDQIQILCSYTPKPKKTGKRVDLSKYQLYLDFFLFSYLSGGMAPIDICYLKYDSVQNNMLTPTRWKTVGGFKVKKQYISITPKMEQLIDKYREQTQNNFVFPIIDKCSVNDQEKTVTNFYCYCRDYIRSICKELKLPVISLYAARHAFATHAISAECPTLDVSKMMGNTPEMIDKHYYQYTEQAQQKNMEKILAYQESNRAK